MCRTCLQEWPCSASGFPGPCHLAAPARPPSRHSLAGLAYPSPRLTLPTALCFLRAARYPQVAQALRCFLRGHLLMRLQQQAAAAGVQGNSPQAQDMVRPLQLLLDRPKVPLRDLLAAACAQARRGETRGRRGNQRPACGAWVLRLAVLREQSNTLAPRWVWIHGLVAVLSGRSAA